jgi:hypothetical protein
MHRGRRGDARASCASPLGTPLRASLIRHHSGFEARHPSKIPNERHNQRSDQHILTLKKIINVPLCCPGDEQSGQMAQDDQGSKKVFPARGKKQAGLLW